MTKSLNEIQQKIEENDKILLEYKNIDYKLRTEQVKLKAEECKKNIGKCYIQPLEHGAIYHKIIAIDDLQYKMRGPAYFNEYVYETMAFSYPYDECIGAFYKETINLCPCSIIKEITKEEYLKVFNEVSEAWIKKVRGE